MNASLQATIAEAFKAEVNHLRALFPETHVAVGFEVDRHTNGTVQDEWKVYVGEPINRAFTATTLDAAMQIALDHQPVTK